MTNNEDTATSRLRDVGMAAVGTVLLATAACGSDSTSTTDTTPSAAESTASAATTTTETPKSDTVDAPETSQVQADTQASTPPATDAADETGGGIDGPVIFSQPAEFGEEAGASGTLSLQEDCLLFNFSDVDEVAAVVWPDETAWDASSESVLSTSGDAIQMDRLFDAGGGFHGLDTVSAFVTDPDALAEVARCVTLSTAGSSIFVIQSPANL